MHYFYEATLQADLTQITLSEQEAHHALKVMRMQVGNNIYLIDGKGGNYTGSITEATKKKCVVQINTYEKQVSPRVHPIHIAIAPTKNMDRIEWFVEKAVEIGVDKISFILTRYSERKVLKMERILKTAIAAMKQSGNLYLPEFQDLQKLASFIPSISETGKYLAYVPAHADTTLFKTAQQEATCVLVGPEGGFSEQEAETLQSQGFRAVSLGKSRLRTETAGIAACHLLNLKMSDQCQ